MPVNVLVPARNRLLSLKVLILINWLVPVLAQPSFTFGILYSAPLTEGWTLYHDKSRGFLEQNLIQQGFVVTSEVCDTCDNEQAYVAMQSWSERRFDLIIATSTVYETVVDRYFRTSGPKVPVINLGSTGTTPAYNFSRVTGKLYQGTYLAGVMCGLVTQTNNIAFIGKFPTYNGNNQINGFLLGAQSVNPYITVHAIFTNQNYHPLLERKSGELLIRDYATDCAWGVAAALQPFVDQHYPVVGSQSDLRYVLGPYVYFSVVYTWNAVYLQYAEQVLANASVIPGTVWSGFDSVLGLSDFSALTPAAIKNQIYNRSLSLRQDGNIFCTKTHCPTDDEISNMPMLSVNVVRSLREDEIIERIFVTNDNPVAITMSVLSGLFTFFALGVAVDMFYLSRGHKIYKASAPLFCLVIISGCLLGLITIHLWAGLPTNLLCTVRIWLTTMSFGLVYGGLLVKNWRICRIFTNNALGKNIKLSDRELLLWGMIPVLLLELLLLTIVTIVDPPQAVVTSTPILAIDQVYLRCETGNVASIIVLVALNFLLVVYGGYIGWKQARYVPNTGLSRDFKESWSITLIIVSTCFCILFAVIVYMGFPYYDPFGEAIVIQLVHILIFGSPLLALFLPKMVLLRMGDTGSDASPQFSTNKSSPKGSVNSSNNDKKSVECEVCHCRDEANTILAEPEVKEETGSSSSTTTQDAAQEYESPKNKRARRKRHKVQLVEMGSKRSEELIP